MTSTHKVTSTHKGLPPSVIPAKAGIQFILELLKDYVKGSIVTTKCTKDTEFL